MTVKAHFAIDKYGIFSITEAVDTENNEPLEVKISRSGSNFSQIDIDLQK
ncbi:MAG: hypothetical protein HS100_20300 [Anaerolineales bacterium]|nr:hypothetical protein [Anaerolineales bacterium]